MNSCFRIVTKCPILGRDLHCRLLQAPPYAGSSLWCPSSHSSSPATELLLPLLSLTSLPPITSCLSRTSPGSSTGRRLPSSLVAQTLISCRGRFNGLTNNLRLRMWLLSTPQVSLAPALRLNPQSLSPSLLHLCLSPQLLCCLPQPLLSNRPRQQVTEEDPSSQSGALQSTRTYWRSLTGRTTSWPDYRTRSPGSWPPPQLRSGLAPPPIPGTWRWGLRY